MNRKDKLYDKEQLKLFESIKVLHDTLDSAFLATLDRSVPLNEVFVDRWERARKLKFGEGTSIYDSSLVLGTVLIGKNCWIGPFTILDGSGGLTIGDYCTISAGSQLYSHDNVKQTLSGGKEPIDRANTEIGSNTYIGPNTIIAKGITLGRHCVVAAQSFVNQSFPDFSIVGGQPARRIGRVNIEDGKISFDYSKKG